MSSDRLKRGESWYKAECSKTASDFKGDEVVGRFISAVVQDWSRWTRSRPAPSSFSHAPRK